jgi:hypothetical protein
MVFFTIYCNVKLFWLIVLFDNPIIIPDTPDPFYGAGDLFMETFAFVGTGLDLIEE